MSELGVLNVERREAANSRISRKLRKNGYVPASISCKGKDSISVAVKVDELKRCLSTYGRYALFKLSLDNSEFATGIVKDIQYSPVKGEMLCVDLQQVSLSEEIRADLPIRLKGQEALEFKKLMVIPQFDSIRVKGLPQDIPDDIVIDVSDIDSIVNINVADIEFPKGIVPELSPDQCVLSIVGVKKKDEDVLELAENAGL
jgi:large subunit ribosomal protein L25